ncbi:MAG: hypothetical protein WCA23_00400, partial [Stellaceae bacterium]
MSAPGVQPSCSCPEPLVLGLVVRAVLGWIFVNHRTGEGEAGGALQLPDPVLDAAEVDRRDALQAGGIDAAELGEPVVVRARKMADISSGPAIKLRNPPR